MRAGVLSFFALLLVVAFSSTNADERLPPGFTALVLGETAQLPGGGRITVAEYSADQSVTSDTLEGPVAGVATWFRVEACAGGLTLEGLTAEANFSLSRVIATGFEDRMAAPHPAARKPEFATPYVPEPIACGTCRDGWVSVVAVGEEQVLEGVNAILFDPARLGMAPPELHVKLAWLLD